MRPEPENLDSECGVVELAEFFSGLAAAADVLRETVEEMENRDGLTEAGDHAFGAAIAAIAALASAEMAYYESDSLEPKLFADYYAATGESAPPEARQFSQFPLG